MAVRPRRPAKRDRKTGATDVRSRIGDEAVRARTGRTWSAWVAELDRAGARELSHRDLAQLLRSRFGLGPWWNQMVAVGYEQVTGRRSALQTASGYSASATLTVPVDIHRLFDAAVDLAVEWLPRGVVIHRTTRPKSLRATATDGRKSISVMFAAVAPGKTQMSAEQGGLASQVEALRIKQRWAASLRRLAAAGEPRSAGTAPASRAPRRTPRRKR